MIQFKSYQNNQLKTQSFGNSSSYILSTNSESESPTQRTLLPRRPCWANKLSIHTLRRHVPLMMVNPHYRDGRNVRCTFLPGLHIVWGVRMGNAHFVHVSKWTMHISSDVEWARHIVGDSELGLHIALTSRNGRCTFLVDMMKRDAWRCMLHDHISCMTMEFTWPCKLHDDGVYMAV
jgi:hypothetical protein